MSAAHIHLLLNHIPLIGTVIAALLLAAGILMISFQGRARPSSH